MVGPPQTGNEEPHDSKKLDRILDAVEDVQREISDHDSNGNIERLRRELKGLDGEEILSLPKIRAAAAREPDYVGCFFVSLLGMATLAMTFSLGPIDFGRSMYNQIIGDTPVLKRQLADYVRKGMRRNKEIVNENDPAELERKLSGVLNAPLKDGKVDPQDVPISTLWDASEQYADGHYARFVWPSLE